jgi:predicted  nucleic acid-binding Zn-ribbon protein
MERNHPALTKSRTHQIALDLLKEEQEMIIDGINHTKPRIKYLQKLQSADDRLLDSYVRYYGGNVSKLMKHMNDLRKRLHEIEDTKRVLKADGQARSDREWAARKELRAARQSLRQGSYNCLGGC